MDSSESSSSQNMPTSQLQSSLQGPRPTPLKVRKDSHKIKKPPIAPPQRQQQIQQMQPHRPPIIIYTVSPKVIHADPREFMSIVQRLTGSTTSSAATPAVSYNYSGSDVVAATALTPRYDASTGKVTSPAARLATYEKPAKHVSNQNLLLDQQRNDSNPFSERFGVGILSPLPTSLPAISPNFFSPSMFIQNQNSSLSPYLFSADFRTSSSMTPNALSSLISPEPNSNIDHVFHLLNEISPAYNAQGSRTMLELSNFMASPTNLLSTSIVPSPSGGYWDLFNQYQDF